MGGGEEGRRDGLNELCTKKSINWREKKGESQLLDQMQMISKREM